MSDYNMEHINERIVRATRIVKVNNRKYTEYQRLRKSLRAEGGNKSTAPSPGLKLKIDALHYELFYMGSNIVLESYVGAGVVQDDCQICLCKPHECLCENTTRLTVHPILSHNVVERSREKSLG